MADGLSLDRLVRMSVLVSAIALDDPRQIILLDLFCRQRNPFPIQLATDFTFKHAAGVVLDVSAGQIKIAEVAHGGTGLQQWCDFSAQETTTLSVS